MNIINRSPNIKKHSLYQWADWMELVCLQDIDGEAICVDNLRDHWNLDSGLLIPEEDESVSETRDERDDETSAKIYDLMQFLQKRNNLFDEYYPFEVRDGDGFIRKKETITDKHKLYVFFLMAANLRFFHEYESGLTSDFQVISSHVLKEMLPISAIIKAFGTTKNLNIEGYSGNKFAKYKKLAEDVGGHLLVKPEELPNTDTGDGGIDLLAWIPTGDNAPYMPLYFVQCGCTGDEERMLSKQDEVSSKLWERRIARTMPIPVMMTPVCFRDGGGLWFKPTEIRTVFIDRVRMIYFLNQKLDDENIQLPQSKDAVDSLLHSN